MSTVVKFIPGLSLINLNGLLGLQTERFSVPDDPAGYKQCSFSAHCVCVCYLKHTFFCLAVISSASAKSNKIKLDYR